MKRLVVLAVFFALGACARKDCDCRDQIVAAHVQDWKMRPLDPNAPPMSPYQSQAALACYTCHVLPYVEREHPERVHPKEIAPAK